MWKPNQFFVEMIIKEQQLWDQQWNIKCISIGDIKYPIFRDACVLRTWVSYCESPVNSYLIQRYQWSWLFSYINRAHPLVKRRALIFSLTYECRSYSYTQNIQFQSTFLLNFIIIYFMQLIRYTRHARKENTFYIAQRWNIAYCSKLLLFFVLW